MTAQNRTERTRKLALSPHTHRGSEVVTRFEHTLTLKADTTPTHITLAFIADRDVPKPGAIEAYLDDLKTLEWQSLEALCATLVEDITDTLVPLLVFAEATKPASNSKAYQSTFLLKTQPNYSPSPFIEGLLRP